jgi:uncharacterized membrane protein
VAGCDNRTLGAGASVRPLMQSQKEPCWLIAFITRRSDRGSSASIWASGHIVEIRRNHVMRRHYWSYGFLGVVVLLGVYLTGFHYVGSVPSCPATPLINCTRVLTSGGSVLIGVPLPLWGAVWAASGMLRLFRWGRRIWIALGGLGLCWAWGHEIALRSICLWCSGMQFGILLAVILGWPRKEYANKTAL